MPTDRQEQAYFAYFQGRVRSQELSKSAEKYQAERCQVVERKCIERLEHDGGPVSVTRKGRRHSVEQAAGFEPRPGQLQRRTPFLDIVGT